MTTERESNTPSIAADANSKGEMVVHVKAYAAPLRLTAEGRPIALLPAEQAAEMERLATLVAKTTTTLKAGLIDNGHVVAGGDPRDNPHAELLDVIEDARDAIDILFATLINASNQPPTSDVFMPSKSGKPWDVMGAIKAIQDRYA